MNNTRQTHHDIPESEWLAVAAERWARWGLEVGPLRGKSPDILGKGGFENFTNDDKQVQRWWERYPTANIGARPPRGWVVLDVDTRHGGLEKWERLNHGHTLPRTLVTHTGSGGLHWWFRLPHTGPIRGRVCEGIDIKHHGGCLVMPPSIHPDTGERYLVNQQAQRDEVPVLPSWLRAAVYRPLPSKPLAAAKTNTPHARASRSAGLVRSVASAAVGERNSTLFWAACRARELHLDLDDYLESAAVAGGLTPSEVRATLASARRTSSGVGHD